LETRLLEAETDIAAGAPHGPKSAEQVAQETVAKAKGVFRPIEENPTLIVAALDAAYDAMKHRVYTGLAGTFKKLADLFTKKVGLDDTAIDRGIYDATQGLFTKDLVRFPSGKEVYSSVPATPPILVALGDVVISVANKLEVEDKEKSWDWRDLGTNLRAMGERYEHRASTFSIPAAEVDDPEAQKKREEIHRIAYADTRIGHTPKIREELERRLEELFA
jgi:hypothetical protein